MRQVKLVLFYMEIKRNKTVDYLRAWAILTMILIHAAAYYLKDKTVYFIWNVLHFAVPVFVFCSSYVFFIKPEKIVNNFFPYFKKRLRRLLIPYYIFLAIYFIIVFLTKPNILSSKFILSSIFLTGGIDINWLVLLFVFFAFLLPLLQYLIKKNYLLFIGYFLLALSSTIFFLFNFKLLIFNYKLYMWLPWSTLVVFTYYFQKKEKDSKFIFFNIIAGVVVFLVSFLVKKNLGGSLSFYSNKYPPNIFYLSYGFTLLNIFYLFFKKIKTNKSALNNLSRFISCNSYSLFFIHYLVIYCLSAFNMQNVFSWPVFFIIVLTFSLGIQKLLTFLF